MATVAYLSAACSLDPKQDIVVALRDYDMPADGSYLQKICLASGNRTGEMAYQCIRTYERQGLEGVYFWARHYMPRQFCKPYGQDMREAASEMYADCYLSAATFLKDWNVRN